MLVAEHMNPGPGSMDPASLGTFQLMPGDAMTKFSHKCSHSIEATSSISKEYVEVRRQLYKGYLLQYLLWKKGQAVGKKSFLNFKF